MVCRLNNALPFGWTGPARWSTTFLPGLIAQAARVSRKCEPGKAIASGLKRQEGFRLFPEDGHVDMESNPVGCDQKPGHDTPQRSVRGSR